MNRQHRRLFKRRNPWGRVLDRTRRRHLPYTSRITVEALRVYWNAVKYPRLTIGDERLAEKAGCSASSVYRAKLLLERVHLVAVTHTRGGWTRNPKGELVRNATGYEPHPEIYVDDRPRQPRATPPASAERPRLIDVWNQLQETRAGP